MKKIISIILSLTMLFAFSSCEKKPEGTDPLTRKEIETIVERFKTLDDSASYSLEFDWGYYLIKHPQAEFYTQKSKLMVKETESGEEMYSETDVEYTYHDAAGEYQDTDYEGECYFKDNRLYTIDVTNGERKGSYQEMTFEEAIGRDEAFSYLPLDYDRLKNASVLRRKNGRTELTYESSDLSFVKEICDVIGEESVITEPFDSANAIFFVKFKTDGSIEKLEYDITYYVPYELDGETLVAELGFFYNIKVKAYGENADITIPVPEDLSSFSKYVEEE